LDLTPNAQATKAKIDKWVSCKGNQQSEEIALKNGRIYLQITDLKGS
jgi:hypothetical protein